MLKFTDFFKQSPQNKLSLKNNTQLAYKGAWIQVYPNTVIDRWYVGDYSSANYTITVEFNSNKKEVLQVLIVARPDQASVTVFGRTSIDDSLVNISATVNDSYVDVVANATDTSFIGSKLIFYAMYAETITPLTISEATSFVDSSEGGGGYDGGGGTVGGGDGGVGSCGTGGGERTLQAAGCDARHILVREHLAGQVDAAQALVVGVLGRAPGEEADS